MPKGRPRMALNSKAPPNMDKVSRLAWPMSSQSISAKDNMMLSRRNPAIGRALGRFAAQLLDMNARCLQLLHRRGCIAADQRYGQLAEGNILDAIDPRRQNTVIDTGLAGDISKD